SPEQSLAEPEKTARGRAERYKSRMTRRGLMRNMIFVGKTGERMRRNMTCNHAERRRVGHLAQVAGVTLTFALLASANAMAACDDRPGTPFPSQVSVDSYGLGSAVGSSTGVSFIWQ